MRHAYHLAARLHGFHHRQEARRAPDQPLLRTASIVRVLERELPHYEIAPGAVDLPALTQALQQAGTTATIRQRVVKWLTVAEQWAGDPHVLLTAVLSVHGVHLTRADLIRHFAGMTPDVIRELGQHQPALRERTHRWIRVARAIHAKLNYPELRSPHEVVVQITESRRPGDARGRVLLSPIWDVLPGAPFEEVLLLIPEGFGHQDEQDFLYERTGKLIRSRAVHSRRADSVPQRQVGEIVVFPIKGVGVLTPQSMKAR
ncbi:hypothetical protein [Deinococcus soli (ex Cha et al. 2016)]|uniref:hypothetical protein n=1 Tax=Deinococcus soli (ex Cha et al. 2016) TaxID=1309411 RepID=UPI00166F1203|nr:hypothetical protein [Deinococcus soli (ex Cha et al. 2016)]